MVCNRFILENHVLVVYEISPYVMFVFLLILNLRNKLCILVFASIGSDQSSLLRNETLKGCRGT